MSSLIPFFNRVQNSIVSIEVKGVQITKLTRSKLDFD